MRPLVFHAGDEPRVSPAMCSDKGTKRLDRDGLAQCNGVQEGLLPAIVLWAEPGIAELRSKPSGDLVFGLMWQGRDMQTGHGEELLS